MLTGKRIRETDDALRRRTREAPACLLACLLAACCSPSPPTAVAPDTGDAAPDVPDAAPDASPDAGDGCAPPPGPPALDAYGGDRRVPLDATGFFRLARLCDRDWLVTPSGHPFYSLGVNTLGPRGSAGRESGERAYQTAVAAKYASEEEWADAAVARLRSWALNTAGSWSAVDLLRERMPFTVILGLADHDWQRGIVADYFDPAWAAGVADKTERLAEHAADDNLVGYFLDNEIRWGPDWRGGQPRASRCRASTNRFAVTTELQV